MLKRRLLPVLYIKNGLIVRSENFDYHQNIGNVINQASRYNSWDADGLIYIDISRSKDYDLRRDDHKIKSENNIQSIIRKISEVCFMPLTFGGGIRTIGDIDLRIRNGADKITLNTAAFENPNFLTEAALKYGSQCIIASVDYRVIDNKAVVFTEWGSQNTNLTALEWCSQLEDLGAGEIFLNCIDRDGQGSGYDIDTINNVDNKINIPLIACGGAGNEYDFLDLAEETDVSAFAAGNWFHFVENSYPRAKKTLRKNNIAVR